MGEEWEEKWEETREETREKTREETREETRDGIAWNGGEGDVGRFSLFRIIEFLFFFRICVKNVTFCC